MQNNYCIRIVKLNPLHPYSKTKQNQKNPANIEQMVQPVG